MQIADVPNVLVVSKPGKPFDTGTLAEHEAGQMRGRPYSPEPVIVQLNKTVNEILAVPSIEKQSIREGADPVGGTPAEFGQFVQREYEKWKVIVRESGATVE